MRIQTTAAITLKIVPTIPMITATLPWSLPPSASLARRPSTQPATAAGSVTKNSTPLVIASRPSAAAPAASALTAGLPPRLPSRRPAGALGGTKTGRPASCGASAYGSGGRKSLGTRA
jgi:hypothetical protein